MRTLVLFLLGSLIGGAASLRCFHCEDCDDKTATVVDCPGESGCYSLLGPVTRRGCAVSCPYNSAFSHEECHMCSDDLCNHHQIGHFMRKKVHHRAHRLRRANADDVPIETRHFADGRKEVVYENKNAQLPALPEPEGGEEEIKYLPPGDPRYGNVDAQGNIYIPVDENGNDLPGYEHLLARHNQIIHDIAESIVNLPENGIPIATVSAALVQGQEMEVVEKEMDVDGEKITQVITDTKDPATIAKEDLIEDEQRTILGAGSFGSASEKKSEAEIERDASRALKLPVPNVSLDEIEEEKNHFERVGVSASPEGDEDDDDEMPDIPEDMDEETMNELAAKIEKVLDKEDEKEQMRENRKKGEKEEEHPKNVPAAKKPSSANVSTVLGALIISLIVFLGI